jgi:hypothetical protein
MDKRRHVLWAGGPDCNPKRVLGQKPLVLLERPLPSVVGRLGRFYLSNLADGLQSLAITGLRLRLRPLGDSRELVSTKSSSSKNGSSTPPLEFFSARKRIPVICQ